jgi:asparagine synthase (glutamine-hydrolysing)
MHFDTRRTVDARVVRAMTDAVSHRGPDGDGHYIDRFIGLGHRRLAIIDLSTGAQPMFSPDGAVVVVFNGEIYNYLELKAELRSRGHRFLTTSDTEVLLAAYEEWGIACLTRLNGMWAFALWDSRQNHLFLSRDRLGEKPLHFAVRDGSFLFGSEIKSVLAANHPAEPAYELLEIYLSLGYVPAPYTLFRNIAKLLPGHYLIVTPGKVVDRPYWDLPSVSESAMRRDADNIYREFEACFEDSVRIRMRSDVPFGAFLSGGLDSSSVVTAMAAASASPVETFTAGFVEKAFDERSLARDVALHCRTNHHEEVVAPEAFDESLRGVLDHFDEPFGDASAIPVRLISRLARSRVTMVLTGDGGDEVLSGYTSYVTEKLSARVSSTPTLLRRGLLFAARSVSAAARHQQRYRLNRLIRFLALADKSFDERLISKFSSVDPLTIQRLVAPTHKQIPIEDFLAEIFRTCPFSDPFYRLMYFNLKVSLPDDMLAKVDRMSMSCGLETRVPFLDHRLVELTYGIDKTIKLPRYTAKSVLRRSYGRKLPASVRAAPKMPFSVPLREWFKGPALRNQVSELQTRDFGLDRSIITQIVAANNTGVNDCGDFMWRLFMLKAWMQRLENGADA